MMTQQSTGADNRPSLRHIELIDPAGARRLLGEISKHPERYDLVLAAILQAIADCDEEEADA